MELEVESSARVSAKSGSFSRVYQQRPHSVSRSKLGFPWFAALSNRQCHRRPSCGFEGRAIASQSRTTLSCRCAVGHQAIQRFELQCVPIQMT